MGGEPSHIEPRALGDVPIQGLLRRDVCTWGPSGEFQHKARLTIGLPAFGSWWLGKGLLT